jgi:formamidopyrimidine-DNA glycosylase
MPELPELEVVTEVLRRRALGQTIEAVEVHPKGGPIVIRDLTNRGFRETLTGATIGDIQRRSKFLLFSMEPPIYLALNPKLTGRLQLADPRGKRLPKTHVVWKLSSGLELRYVDQRTMGQLYLTDDLDRVPDYAGLGPEPFDVSLAEFRERLKPYRGEIKGVLTRGEFIAGIGNAYADEILWAARIHPYRKRTTLSAEEIERLYMAMQSTLRVAIERVRVEMGENIHLEPREFLAVHMKSGEPCPRCGTPISLVGANQRITNFCRTCQPGGLIKGM